MRSLIAIAALVLVTPSAKAQVVDHYYLDPQNIEQISKFRSCAGHHYGYEHDLLKLRADLKALFFPVFVRSGAFK